MARNMYGATSADFTLTAGGRVIPGAVLTLWSARTGGTQITDLLDVDSVATTTVTSDASGAVVYYGPNNDKTVHWADSGQGSRVAIRPVDITGDPPVMSIGTVGTGTAAASLTGTSEAPVLNLTLPSAGANGVDTAAIQSKAVTAAKIADDTITAAQIAANAVGASELADNAVDTAAIADSAVTSAKIADGTIVAGDVAAGTFAAFGTVGNLLTANQASIETDTTGLAAWNDCTIARTIDIPSHGTYCLKVTPTGAAPYAGTSVGTAGVPVTARETYTATVDMYVLAAASVMALVYWYSAAGALVDSSYKAATFSGESRKTITVTAVAPDTAAFAAVGVYTNDAAHDFYLDKLGLWKGASGQWAMPGTPITGGSHIATNGAVHLSGTGSPEGVVTAAPGSTWLQTDSTTDVKGWIRWIKATGTGNTGWVAGAEADTGWRDVSADLLNSWTVAAASSFRIRRVGNVVQLRAHVSGGTLGAAVYAIPSGFRPTYTQYFLCSDYASGAVIGGGYYGSSLVRTGNNAAAYPDLTYFTDQSWPTSLPGTV